MATKNHKKKSSKPYSHANSRGASSSSEELPHETQDDIQSYEEIEVLHERVVEEASEEGPRAPDAPSDSSAEASFHSDGQQENPGEKLEFPYSELVRAYAPKAMEVADKVVTDWKSDGSFMNLGIENPYANMAVSLGLKKAKDLEKKLDEKGVLSVVRMGVEVLKQQVNRRK